MRIYDENGEIIAIFYSVKRKGGQLVVDAKVLDSLRMDMVFRPREVMSAMKMVFSWQVISFMFMLPFFGVRELLRKPKAQQA